MTNTQSRFGRSHVVAGAFVFLLLGIFAVFSTVMVLLSAQLYRGTVEDTQAHGAQRVAANYLMNIVRGNDASDGICVVDHGGVKALTFTLHDGEDSYETRVYCYDGHLREMFCEAGDDFDPGFGETICEAQSFEPEMTDGMLTMQLTDGSGREQTLYAALRCPAGEEAQP